MIDEVAELFKGELGSIHDIESMTLKELVERRDIRIARKIAEQKAEEQRQKTLEKQRERDAMRGLRKR